MAAESSAARRTWMGGSRVGLIFLAGGVLLLGVVGAFFGYQAYIYARYDDVTATAPLTLPTDQELFAPLSTTVSINETPSSNNPDWLPLASVYPWTEIAPQFWANPFWAKDVDDGNITAGNASQISDGGAAVVITTLARAEALGVEPLAEVVGHGQVAGPDTSLLHQPSNAIRLALDHAGLGVDDLDLLEINEAFAAVALASMDALGVGGEIVNVNGGAIALDGAKDDVINRLRANDVPSPPRQTTKKSAPTRLFVRPRETDTSREPSSRTELK